MAGVVIDPVEIIDVSKWQPNISWSCMKARGVIGSAMRATISVYYLDPTFQTNARGTKDNGVIRMPYHVTRCDDKILGMNNSPTAQMDFFGKSIEGFHDGIVVLDVELAHLYDGTGLIPKQKVTDVNMACWEIAKSRYDEVYSYSRASFMDEFMNVDPRFKEIDLWLAEYGPNTGLWYGSNLVPKGCTRDQIIIHQFTSKGKPFCCDPSVNALDYDLIINVERFNQIHKVEDQEPELPNEEWYKARLLELESRVLDLENNFAGLEDRINKAKLTI